MFFKWQNASCWIQGLWNEDFERTRCSHIHHSDVIMGAMASQITSLTIVYSTVYSGEYQRKHQSSASLAFVRGIHRWPVNSPHKWPVTRKMFPFDDVIMRRWRESRALRVQCEVLWYDFPDLLNTHRDNTYSPRNYIVAKYSSTRRGFI